MTRRDVVSVFRSLGVVAVVCAGLPMTAMAQTQPCDENARQALQTAVDSGATDAEIEAQFGRCRVESTSQSVVATSISFNTYYEKMNSCGLHPQKRQPACDVQIQQSGGYGAFPTGSNEHALFCFDCDRNGTYEYSVLGTVHVTNNVSGTLPSWYHAVNAVATNTPSTCAWGSGRAINVKVILSWSAKPTSCAYRPIWGNAIFFPARLDP